MKLSDLIKQSTDILAQHGNLFVDIEFKNQRKLANCLDLESSKIGCKGFVAVIVGGKDDNDSFETVKNDKDFMDGIGN